MKGGIKVANTNVDINDNIPSGLKTLIKGYSDYASEVVLERAIPAIDGLKPSQRRILYTMYRNKNTHLTKSANVVGEVMKLHPHGDMSIYDTLVRLTDDSKCMNIPYITGKGNFGKVFFTEKAAAPRYTECMLSPYSKLLFGEMSGIDMIPSYDNKFTEPLCLPVAFPTILANPTQGIAVGMASNIPAYNMVEVNNAVIELIGTGSISKPLMPDYATGSVYVRDDAELEKIMKKGKGRIKLRGKWHFEGKSIVIDEIPYYTNIDSISKIMDEDPNVLDVRDESDFNGLRLVIECRSKARMEEVLVVLLRDTQMQMTIASNISVIINNKPRTLGVTELIKEWIKFRKKVLKKKLKIDLNAVKYDIQRYSFLIKLLNDREAFDKYIECVKKSEADGRAFLRDFDRLVSDDCINWVMGLSFKSISNIGQKQKHLDDLYAQSKQIISDLNNIDGVICNQLREINQKYGVERKTEIGTDDYSYTKSAKEKPAPTKCFVTIKNKFIFKYQTYVNNTIECMSNDYILVIDSQSRMLRINLEDIEYFRGSHGTYLPVYLGIPDDFDIIDYHLEEDAKSTYFYNDGYVSVVNWGKSKDNKRKIKVSQRATSQFINSALINLPTTPYVVCYTVNGRFGIAETKFMEKSPTARTKLIGVDSDDVIKIACGANFEDLLRLTPNFNNYMGKCKRILKNDTLNIEYFKELLKRGTRN